MKRSVSDHLKRLVGDTVPEAVTQLVAFFSAVVAATQVAMYFTAPYLRWSIYAIGACIFVLAALQEGRRRSSALVGIDNSSLPIPSNPVRHRLFTLSAVLCGTMLPVDAYVYFTLPLVDYRDGSFEIKSPPPTVTKRDAEHLATIATACVSESDASSPDLRFTIQVKKHDYVEEAVLSTCSVSVLDYKPLDATAFKWYDPPMIQTISAQAFHGINVKLKPQVGIYTPTDLSYVDDQRSYSGQWADRHLTLRDPYWSAFTVFVTIPAPGYYSLQASLEFFSSGKSDHTIAIASTPVQLAVLPEQVVYAESAFGQSDDPVFGSSLKKDEFQQVEQRLVTLNRDMTHSAETLTTCFVRKPTAEPRK